MISIIEIYGFLAFTLGNFFPTHVIFWGMYFVHICRIRNSPRKTTSMVSYITVPSSMVFLVSILLLYDGSQALPVYHESRMPDPSETTLSKRTLVSITWSCILTTFICAWTSVHPNVPPQNQSQTLLRRIRLMFWTIISPELVLAWAVISKFGEL